MKLLNSRGETIASDLKIASSLSDKAKGLIGADKPFPIFFKTRWGIHTFGVKFPIDCVVCDKNLRVGKIRGNLKPNRIFFWNPALPVIIELPSGTIEKSSISEGDVLNID